MFKKKHILMDVERVCPESFTTYTSLHLTNYFKPREVRQPIRLGLGLLLFSVFLLQRTFQSLHETNPPPTENLFWFPVFLIYWKDYL